MDNKKLAVALMLVCGLGYAAGQATPAAGVDGAETAKPAGLFDGVKSLFGSSKGQDKSLEKEQEKIQEVPSDSVFSKLKAMVGMSPAPGASPMQLKAFDEVWNVAAKQYDPGCKAMVEPFGVTDSALSLGVLAGKIGANNFLVPYVGGKPIEMRDMLKMAGKNLNWLPMDAERMLGEREHANQAADLLDGERKTDKAAIVRAQKMLDTLLAQVKEETPYKFQIFVRKGAGNAQALPGGYIHIDRDLVIQPKNEDRAYFALAHEIAHVLQRHETHATQARLTDTIDTVDRLRKLIEGSTSSPAMVLGYSNELMTRFVTFSKAQEMQADACAVRLLERAMPDKKRLSKVIRGFQNSLGPQLPESTVTGLDMLVQNVKKMGNLDNEHPNTRERSANLDKMLLEVSKPAASGTKVAGH